MDKINQEEYEQNMRCNNCGYSYIKSIKIGVPASGFHTCPNCGCHDAQSTGMPEQEGIKMKTL